MGQRLVITIQNHSKDLAKIYYHWSAYSKSALQEAKELIDHIQTFGFVVGENEAVTTTCFECGEGLGDLVVNGRCRRCGLKYHCRSVTEKELQLKLIRFFEARCGGVRVAHEEERYVKNLFPGELFKQQDISRNNGIVALSPRGMADLQSWSEGDILISLDRREIQNNVFYSYDGIDHFTEEHDDPFAIALNEIPVMEEDIETIPFSRIDNVMMALDSLHGYLFRNGEIIYELIA